jgi:hypothetical protein
LIDLAFDGWNFEKHSQSASMSAWSVSLFACARVAHVGDELDEVLARLLVETARDVRLREPLDRVVDDGLHLRVFAVVARLTHRPVEHLVEALDRRRALRGIVEALHPGLRIVLVRTSHDARRRDDDRSCDRPHEREVGQDPQSERSGLLHSSSPKVASKRENPPFFRGQK